MSVGFSNPIGGSNVAFNMMARSTTSKGGGGAIQGWMPQTLQTTDKRYENFEHIRFTLKNAWNTVYKQQLAKNNLTKSITTPFRAVNNAGDLLSRTNYACGGTCQSVQSRPNINGIKHKLGGTSKACTSSAFYSENQIHPDIPSATCNVKYVYDSSNYTRFLKQQAVSRNYNDLTFGGDDSHSSQSAIKAIRRY